MICREAQVSRQTFYTLFGNKENVLIYLLQASCCYKPEQKKSACRSADFRCFCQGYSSYIIEKRNILELLVKNDMMHCLYDVQYESIMGCEQFMQEITGDDRIYLIDFIASGMNSIAKNYVITGCHADEEFIEKLMYRLFGGIYFSPDYRYPTDNRAEE
jgi:AcrR family transcriptional regulator